MIYMTDEKTFDYENYIQEQLRRIDDLDERRFARELLMEGLGMGTLTGVSKSTGESMRFQIRRSDKYRQNMDRLYRLFTGNHVPWQTVHMGHVERFFDLVPETETGEVAGTDWMIQDEKWNTCIKRGMMLLWNIRQSAVRSREFRVPCRDEVFYEHVFYLPQEREAEEGYLVDAAEAILSVRYEKNRIVLRTKAESLEDITIYGLCQREPEKSAGYRFPVLSNRRKDNLSARYSQQTGNFIQTPLELSRKVEEMADGYRIRLLGYEILDRAEEDFLEGDMNSFTGVRMFTDDKRKILLFRIGAEARQQEDYLYESQIRYILSQLQLEFLEYRCMGVLETNMEK